MTEEGFPVQILYFLKFSMHAIRIEIVPIEKHSVEHNLPSLQDTDNMDMSDFISPLSQSLYPSELFSYDRQFLLLSVIEISKFHL